MTEHWKDITGYEGRYQVSDRGRMRGLKGELSLQRQNSGYLVVHLYLSTVRRVYLVHRLVAEHFVAGRFDGACVNHINGFKRDNVASNLEWVTRSGNMLHAHRFGLLESPKKAVYGVSLADGSVIRFASQLEAETTLTGKASSAIHHCIVGKKKSAYGYVWRRT